MEAWMEAVLAVLGTAALHYAVQLVVLVRALTRPGREPASRLAWVLVILAVPALGVVLYLLLGEVSPGRRRFARLQAVREALPVTVPGAGHAPLPAEARGAFARAAAVNGFAPVPGNAANLLAGNEAAVEALVADIDAARETVHLLVYIWLDDTSGRRLMAAVTRAALRGVRCRVMVDGLGSRRLLRSKGWAAMRAAGVETGIAFDTSLAPVRMLMERIDIRNHRKIFVIDGAIAYCGSQNCADAAFDIKPRHGPWVDLMLRLEGPVVWQMQALFLADWLAHSRPVAGPLAAQAEAEAAALLAAPAQPQPGGFAALAYGTGPDLSSNAVPDVVGLLLAAAQREVVLTTPYFVPTPGLEEQLCATALRGVAVTLILPARNDSRMVYWASRASYPGLLRAGVAIHEHAPGLLHAKAVTVDGALAMVGSANLDRRSFELNFENNLLISDPAVTAALRVRQQSYLADSRPVTADQVAAWTLPRRLLYNAVAMLSPVL
ncbi:MAG: phospholipase D-like domain-containing protein [Pararhodobacter sp.]